MPLPEYEVAKDTLTFSHLVDSAYDCLQSHPDISGGLYQSAKKIFLENPKLKVSGKLEEKFLKLVKKFEIR